MLGMEGVYVANVFDHQEVEKSKSRSSITPATLELYKKTVWLLNSYFLVYLLW